MKPRDPRKASLTSAGGDQDMVEGRLEVSAGPGLVVDHQASRVKLTFRGKTVVLAGGGQWRFRNRSSVVYLTSQSGEQLAVARPITPDSVPLGHVLTSWSSNESPAHAGGPVIQRVSGDLAAPSGRQIAKIRISSQHRAESLGEDE